MVAALKAWWATGKVAFAIALLAILTATHIAAYRAGGAEGRREVATQAAERAQATLQALLEASEKAAERDKELRKKLDGLPSSHTLETIIRENPSVCIVPGPVDERLRQDIRAVNQARAR